MVWDDDRRYSRQGIPLDNRASSGSPTSNSVGKPSRHPLVDQMYNTMRQSLLLTQLPSGVHAREHPFFLQRRPFYQVTTNATPSVSPRQLLFSRPPCSAKKCCVMPSGFATSDSFHGYGELHIPQFLSSIRNNKTEHSQQHPNSSAHRNLNYQRHTPSALGATTRSRCDGSHARTQACLSTSAHNPSG